MDTSEPEAQRPISTSTIGVFGGTFDPVHIGHLRIAIDTKEALGLSEIRLIPLAHAVHRNQPETPADLRLAMLRAAVTGRAGLVVDDREMRREGPSYTVDTLTDLRTEENGRALCLLLGTDAFNGFTAWHRPDAILEMANIALLRRPQTPIASAIKPLYDTRRVDHLDPHRSGQIIDSPVSQLDISSTEVRRRVHCGLSIDFLVPDPVLEIIRRQHLYRDNPAAH